MPLRILIVDDSSTTRAIIRKTLSMAGIEIEERFEAEEGGEALSILQENDVDLVLSDINMPGMGGVELVERMQQDPRLEKVPIVMVTTEGSASRMADLKKKGVRDFIRKPFTPEQLRDAINKITGDSP